jgi:hypothetical protein
LLQAYCAMLVSASVCPCSPERDTTCTPQFAVAIITPLMCSVSFITSCFQTVRIGRYKQLLNWWSVCHIAPHFLFFVVHIFIMLCKVRSSEWDPSFYTSSKLRKVQTQLPLSLLFQEKQWFNCATRHRSGQSIFTLTVQWCYTLSFHQRKYYPTKSTRSVHVFTYRKKYSTL